MRFVHIPKDKQDLLIVTGFYYHLFTVRGPFCQFPPHLGDVCYSNSEVAICFLVKNVSRTRTAVTHFCLN